MHDRRAPATVVRVLELRSVRGTGGGPEKTILQGAASAGAGISVTVCYIRNRRDPDYCVDQRASAAGVDYVELQERHSLDPSIWRPLRELVQQRAVDVIHSHEYKTDLLAWLLARSTGAAPLATAHGWTGHSRRERFVYYPADKRLLRRFPMVVAVSSEVKGELVAHGCRPDRVRVLLNGIDHRRFCRDPVRIPEARKRFGLSDGLLAIGAVGRLEPQKRFDLLIAAFRRVAEDWPRARLLIAGDGSLRESLQRLIATNHLEARCRLLGHLDDVMALHHALDVYVQSSDYEGTPNAVLEAMALGTPIVATAAGGTGELVTDGREALIVPPGNPEALATAIQAVLSDAAAASQRAVLARQRIETHLSFEGRLRALEGIYRELAVARHRQ